MNVPQVEPARPVEESEGPGRAPGLIFFRLYVGELIKQTSHLSLVEFGAFMRAAVELLSSGRALTEDLAKLARRLQARSEEERTALNEVIYEFFQLHSDGWHSEFCDRIVEESRAASRKGSDNANKGWQRRRQAAGSDGGGDGCNVDARKVQTRCNDVLIRSQKSEVRKQCEGPVPVDNPAAADADPTHKAAKPPTLSPEYRAIAIELRPDLEPVLADVWRDFVDHLVDARQRTKTTWRKWVQREHAPGSRQSGYAPAGTATTAGRPDRDPELVRLDRERDRGVPATAAVKELLASLSAGRRTSPSG